VTYDEIQRRLEWLSSLGIRKVNLSGGEPTIRRDLPGIVSKVHELGLTCAMTTNGIRLSPELLETLVAVGAKVKVSLHGPGEFHDRMLGVTCFESVDDNIARLHDAGVAVAIQTVVTRRKPDIHEWAIDYCLARGISKLRFVPFVPRGRGVDSADEFQLSPADYRALLDAVATARAQLAPRLDVAVLDFWIQEYYVLETDGTLQIQRETDAADSTVAYAA
jgi:MoaA/NifB/PqqE/SkfB family radical SAM enzyme